jgi:hypothetical protein
MCGGQAQHSDRNSIEDDMCGGQAQHLGRNNIRSSSRA